MDQDIFTSIVTIGLCLLAPIIMVIFGFVGRAILVAKGYSGFLGFVLGAVGGVVGLIIALILPKATQQATRPSSNAQMSNSGLGKQSFAQNDNLGTFYNTTSRGKSYWQTRMMQGPDYPFVAYDFDNERDAQDALLELPCIHMAEDTRTLICTEVLDFGCYQKSSGSYSAFICGKDLTHELWEQAKTSFAKHRGTRSNDQEPEKKSTPIKKTTTARPDKVVFVKDMSGINNMGARYTKKRYSAPDAASAKAYLQQHPVTEPFYYIEIDTPEGNFGRDIQGIYEYD